MANRKLPRFDAYLASRSFDDMSFAFKLLPDTGARQTLGLGVFLRFLLQTGALFLCDVLCASHASQ